MKRKRLLILFLCCTLLIQPASLFAQVSNDTPPPLDAALEQRRALADSGTLLQPFAAQAVIPAATGPSLAEAIDTPMSMLASASVEGHASASAVLSGLGVISPRQGSTFALLSTGVAGANRPEPGTDFEPKGTSGDRVTLVLALDVPQGINRLSFDYNFLSAETPEYVGSRFDDTFTVVVTDNASVHEAARASVNSSVFIEVSASNAGGTGFDLFTEDPSKVDVKFGSGLPDAGLTGFKSVSIAIAGGGPVTLAFTIEDLGDGILDSAVILDNLSLSSLEVVDPNPVFLENGTVINNPSRLAQGGQLRIGAAADGVTKLLLRSKVSGAGTMEYCLANGSAPEDGGFMQLGSSGRATCVTTAAVSTPQGFMAFAVYQTPDEFNAGGDETRAARLIEFRARYTPAGGTVQESTRPILLVRPPVVAVHGLWSGEDTWTFSLINDSRFSVSRVNYFDTHASHFDTNLRVPYTNGGIREAITKLRGLGIAATQVDIIGHSMGGILSRNYVNSAQYKRKDNYNAGDLHKLITLNTPHTGSPLGNLIVATRESLKPIDRFLLEEALRLLNHAIDEGAIDDLASGSAAIRAIQRTLIPGHALVGIGGSEQLESAPGPLGAFYRTVNFFVDTTGLFQGLQHDYIVGRNSQEGGLPASAYTVFDGTDSIHTNVTGSSNYSDRLIELLNSPASGPLFAQFPAGDSLSSASIADVSQEVDENIDPALVTSLLITSPADGTQVTSGSTVRVVVAPESGTVVKSVLLVGTSVALIDDTAPFEFDLPIPLEAAGRFEITAVGKDDAGNFTGSNRVVLYVVTPAALESIALIPKDPILFEIGEKRTLGVFGEYADGVMRNVTSADAGTEYLTSDPAVVIVSLDGVLTAVGVGVATVIARQGSIQDSVSVTVLLPNETPIANAGADFTGAVSALVTLDGSSSLDADNGPAPLSFEWAQIAGPPVSLTGAQTPTPSFVPQEIGEYVFSLIVRDGQADSVPDSVVVTVGEGQPLPDLMVQNVTINENGVQVVIKNQGNIPIPAEQGFWVDLYIDPSAPPTQPNQIWNFLADEGLVWGVDGDVLPMEPGEVITLTIGDALYWPDLSKFSGTLPPGTPIYVQVDSANTDSSYGGVLESHEATSGPYNNVAGPVPAVAATVRTKVFLPLIDTQDQASAADLAEDAPLHTLPSRVQSEMEN